MYSLEKKALEKRRGAGSQSEPPGGSLGPAPEPMWVFSGVFSESEDSGGGGERAHWSVPHLVSGGSWDRAPVMKWWKRLRSH